MVIKKIFAAILCCLAGFFLTFSSAAAEGNIKIGVLDIQKVLVNSVPGQAAKSRFDEKKTELEASFTKEQEALKELQDEIEKKSSVWTTEKKDEKVLEFNKMRRDLQAKSEDARLEMKQLQDKELEPIIKALEKVVDEYGAKNGYTVILDSKSGVVFAGEGVDVSDEVIKELNKAMK